MKNKYVAGRRFGLLTAVKEVGRDRHGNVRWLFHCDCGKEKVAYYHTATAGDVKSCGCASHDWQSSTAGFHGKQHPREFSSWKAMLKRCYCETNRTYPRYGGRGIVVCERWRNSFLHFLTDMGVRPVGTTIDRIDVNGNYEPGNCRWATMTEQQRNRRDNQELTFQGKTQCQSAWALETGLSRQVISIRLKRGWPVERVLSTSTKRTGRPRRIVDTAQAS